MLWIVLTHALHVPGSAHFPFACKLYWQQRAGKSDAWREPLATRLVAGRERPMRQTLAKSQLNIVNGGLSIAPTGLHKRAYPPISAATIILSTRILSTYELLVLCAYDSIILSGCELELQHWCR
jgi:hypothetical protein